MAAWELALQLVGVVFLIAKVVLPLFRRLTRSGVHPTKYGKWVIITGATDGIGKGLAFAFAEKGMNILLISRTQSKLDAVATEIKTKYAAVETQTLAIDYSKFDAAAVSKVKSTLEGLDDIAILVNNVGMSYPFPQYFHELSDEEVDALMTLNVKSTTIMTRLVLPFFLAKETNANAGAILNIGSFAGLFPNPLLAEYSAAKAYVEKLSSSLAIEYASKGISVQCHVPLYVVSKLSKFKKPSFNIPSPEKYATEVIGTIGNGQSVVSAHPPHSLMTTVIGALPAGPYGQQVLGMHLGIRKKGLAKREKQQKTE